AFPEPVILDGEILAWHTANNRALPFSELQKRLGRKQVSEQLVHDVPVAYMVFDVLYAAGELTIDRLLEERRALVERAVAAVPEGAFRVSSAMATAHVQGKLTFDSLQDAGAGPERVILAPVVTGGSAEQLEEMFAAARERVNEGLMIKDLE